jgi:hypothetical protein
MQPVQIYIAIYRYHNMQDVIFKSEIETKVLPVA